MGVYPPMDRKRAAEFRPPFFDWCAGHGAQRRDRRCQPRRETESGSDLEVRVLWGPWQQEPLAEQQPRHREVSWERSCEQSPGPRNTNRIGGDLPVGEGAKRPEARCCPDRTAVDAAGLWGESHAPYPGRSVRLPFRLGASQGAARGGQKSAEAG